MTQFFDRAAAIAGALLVSLSLSTGSAGAGTIVVSAGGNLQSALNAAQPGDLITLQAGATFVGNFVLPAKTGSGTITIRSSVDDGALPNGRIGLQHAGLLATIKSPNALPALKTARSARGWYITAVRFVGGGSADVITLGDGSPAQNTPAIVPRQIVLDRVLVLGDPVKGQKRGIALNSAETTIKNSYIADIKLPAQETQAIAGWNGPGPFVIENNYLEAAGVNVLFGGAAPYIPNLVPSDIVIRGNHITKRLEWRNTTLTVKNLFELKNARRVLVEGNLLEHNWPAAQAGYAVLFTVRNPGNVAPWSTVEDVTFQDNVVRRAAAGVNILGYDTNAVSQQTRRIVIRNNLFDEIDHTAWGGNGVFLQIGEEPADVTVEHNTVIQTGNVVTAYGGPHASPRPINGFRFVDNIALHNLYGIFGSSWGTGLPAIAQYFPGAEIRGNVLAGGNASRYPPGNYFPTVAELMAQFENPAAHDYRLQTSSLWLQSATDGSVVGVDFERLTRALLAGSGAVAVP